MKRPRLSGFLYSYLLCALLVAGIMLGEVLDKQRIALEDGESISPLLDLIRTILTALALSLCCIPIRILLGFFPEASTNGVVRTIRRVVIGALCGPLPIMTVVLLSRGEARGGEVLGIGLLFGAVVGLGDSLARDDTRSRESARDEPLSEDADE